jgi:hypothetical protein
MPGLRSDFSTSTNQPRKNMHYKNGRAAKNGDQVVMIQDGQPPVAGILYGAVAGNDSCNGRIACMRPTDAYPDLRNVLHLDDVKNATIPDSTPALAA